MVTDTMHLLSGPKRGRKWMVVRGLEPQGGQRTWGDGRGRAARGNGRAMSVEVGHEKGEQVGQHNTLGLMSPKIGGIGLPRMKWRSGGTEQARRGCIGTRTIVLDLDTVL